MKVGCDVNKPDISGPRLLVLLLKGRPRDFVLMRGEQLSTSDVFEMAAEKRLLIIVGKGQMFSHTTSDEAMDVEPDARVTGERNRRPVKKCRQKAHCRA